MAESLRYDGQVVVVTGAGGGLGREYARFYASRGAKLVINDLGGSLKGGDGQSSRAADIVVKELKDKGTEAVANYDSVTDGERIIETAIKAFGRIDILINNAGILRDCSFKNMKDADWDLIQAVHVKGSYKCTHAAWPYFKKQKYGRIINTASAAGLFGNFGQANYSSAKLALVGFTETLAKEGFKYNIQANAIAPIAASRMTEAVMPKEMFAALGPEWVVPLVAVLTHKQNKETGAIFEVGGGHVAKLRWERSNGLLLQPDASYTPGAILSSWDKVTSFSNPQYPTGPNDFIGLLDQALKMPPSAPAEKLSFKGRVALVTGGGAGLGRIYCLEFARHGAKVVVNDLADPDGVVSEIRKLGGEAIGVKASAEEGEKVVGAAIEAFGRIDIIINNAGILRDKAFANMSEDLWDAVQKVHLHSTYKITKAAWPHFLKQKYGRVINTTSTSGIYGNFGQANYAAAKAGILGFSRAIALEGAKYNIYVNTIAPNAGTAMTKTILPAEIVEALKPDFVAPLVLALCSDKVPKKPTGCLYEVGSGWCGQTRWQRSGGVGFPIDVPLTPEALAHAWSRVVDFKDGRADNPSTLADSMSKMMENVQKVQSKKTKSKPADSKSNEKYLKAIAAAQKTDAPGTEYSWTERDSILYNLGAGAKRTDLKYVFEGSNEFQVLPTFGVIPPFGAATPWTFDDLVPNFNPMLLLHGEQYLELKSFPLPTAATVINKPKLIEVVDKKNASIVKQGVSTFDKETGKELFYTEATIFLRGAGGFGGQPRPSDRGAASAANKPPSRAPDAVVEEKTTEEQAAIYRLSGDLNPLHIDPEFASAGGFKAPILHGLCFFAVAGKAVYERFGEFKNIKVRFAGTVIPGQTLVTEMWRDGNRVTFQVRVKETGKFAITGAAAELASGNSKM